MAEKLRKETEKSSDKPEDLSQIKDPPECGMLVQVVPGLDPADAIPLSKEIEQESTEPPLLPQHN